jgi:Zn-dependent protease with chaperone function
MKKKFISFAILSVLTLGLYGFAMVQEARALDTGLNVINNTIQLGKEDPRAIVARIINTAMMFLGIIAVVIVLIGGFKWMTAGGNEDKVSEAKKLMGSGVVGLVIVLASWGIAQFIVKQLQTATNN